MMNSYDGELQIPPESNLGIGKFLREEEPYFPWSATGIRSPFPVAPQQDFLLCEAARPENNGDLDMSSDCFGFTFPNQELLAQHMMNPHDKFVPGIDSCCPTSILKIINMKNPTSTLQLPKEVLDPPFPHHTLDYYNSLPEGNYESMQTPRGGNSDFSHPRQIPRPFRHFPRSPFQVKNWGISSRVSQVSKRRRPLMLQLWVEKIVPALEWSKLQLQILGVDQGGGGGDEVGNGVVERHNLDAVAHAVNHKMKERIRRSEFNGKMQTLISLVPTIKKKDKVSVLTSTIEYIRELSSAIGMRALPLPKPLPNKTTANLTDNIILSHSGEAKEEEAEAEEVEAARLVEGSGTELRATTSVNDAAAEIPPSSSAQQHPTAPDFVFVELACGGDAFVANVDTETSSPAQVLIHLLKVLKDLHLHLLKIECCSEHGRLNATISATMPLDQNLSCDEVHEVLQRALDCGSLQSSSSD